MASTPIKSPPVAAGAQPDNGASDSGSDQPASGSAKRDEVLPAKREVSSLLDEMEDGREYSSLLGLSPKDLKIEVELRRAIAEVERIRGCPLMCYAGNILKSGGPHTTVELHDDLPFSEMVSVEPMEAKKVDLFVATPGGSAQQVNSFVTKLRPRFESVAFIVPNMCLSAGTIWATSGDEIVMDERGFLGPIDPQVRNRDGQLVPAQALFALISKIQERGQEALSKKQNPKWTDQALLKLLDPKELGHAISGTNYSVQLVAEYLSKYKFAPWTHHKSSGLAVSDEDRQRSAHQIAALLGSHEEWNTHSHGIFRDVLWQKLKLEITHPKMELTRAIRRLWALFYWCFDRTPIMKVMLSQRYSFFRAVRTGKPT